MIFDRSSGQTEALATARWADWAQLSKLTYRPGWFWLGESFDDVKMPLGHLDDRHICLVAGSRGGKGTTVIINNLTLWPGSVVVVDPKGENAIVTARRRAGGSAHSEGLGQKTYILDPFNTVHRDDDDFSDLKACFNPLDAIEPFGEEAIDEASRIADAIVVQSKNTQDPFWEESARSLIKGLILHILTAEEFEGRRNLITLRQLLTRGDYRAAEFLAEQGDDPPPNPFFLLWEGLRDNPHHDGVISGVGESFNEMARTADKTFTSVMEVARRQTEFIDSPGMRRCLATSDFKLSDLKTSEQGVSLYLSLPQRYMNTHFRWLRMMTALTVTEMEKTRGQPKSGHRVMMFLDEFAGLKKMDVIENAAAQIAGFGVKLFIILQTLGQLKEVYKDNWQVFLGNSGLKIFFQIEDEFTRTYLSKQLGETEVIRETVSRGASQGESSGMGMNYSSLGNQAMALSGLIPNSNEGSHSGSSVNASEGIHKTALITPDEIGREFARVDEKRDGRYPGLALIVLSGFDPIRLRRTNYFDHSYFRGRFDQHPDFPVPPLLSTVTPKPSVLDRERAVTAALYDEFGLLNVAKAELVYEAVSEHDTRHPILALAEASFAEALLAHARREIRPGTSIEEAVDRAASLALEYFERNRVAAFPADLSSPQPPPPPMPAPEPSAQLVEAPAVLSAVQRRKPRRTKAIVATLAGVVVLLGGGFLGLDAWYRAEMKKRPLFQSEQQAAKPQPQPAPAPSAPPVQAQAEAPLRTTLSLFTYPWEEPDPALLRRVAALSPIDGNRTVPSGSGGVLVSRLPWYDNVRLVRIRNGSWQPANLYIYYLIDSKGELHRLDGTSNKIHAINKSEKINIDQFNALQYLWFFCFFVRGEEGPFLIAEYMDDAFLPNNFEKNYYDAVKSYIHPAKLTRINTDSSFDADVTMMYSNAFFKAQMRILHTGMVEMVNDEPVVADMNVKIDAPIK
ncbi:type IV secretory system conjugative DNA transfer family protein [Geminicoccus roseus]|uniref:type IV secretory system conjugative DNA transfer family protein n=1 Tax=Geminicoccus roseus TaxID=404900 RepID=UPI000429AF84|nr:type IV secretory system conjugative DNA transfer family protein [Geminicoccus roseus]